MFLFLSRLDLQVSVETNEQTGYLGNVTIFEQSSPLSPWVPVASLIQYVTKVVVDGDRLLYVTLMDENIGNAFVVRRKNGIWDLSHPFFLSQVVVVYSNVLASQYTLCEVSLSGSFVSIVV